MDANGTKFKLLLGRADWARCTDVHGSGHELGNFRAWQLEGVASSAPIIESDPPCDWDEARAELTLRQQLFEFRQAGQANPVALPTRRGAARDRYGNWYWIAESGQELLVNSAGTHNTTHFWAACDGVQCEPASEFGAFQTRGAAPAPVPGQLRGLTITVDHFLLVGTLEPGGLLVFDLHAGGPPQWLLWTSETPFAPFDLAARPGGGAWILDRDFNVPSRVPRLWEMDRHLHIVTQNPVAAPYAPSSASDLFQPKTPLPPLQPAVTKVPPPAAAPVLDADAWPLPGLDAVAIEVLPDNTVLVLADDAASGFAQVFPRRPGQAPDAPLTTAVIQQMIEPAQHASFTLRAHDFAFVPAPDGAAASKRGTLYFVAPEGNQAFAFALSESGGQWQLKPLPEYLPLRAFGGKGLVAAGAQVYYDFADRWIPLVAQNRPRYAVAGVILSEVFDSAEPDCVWHRVMLDACLPPETRVSVRSRAANEQAALDAAPWQSEPQFYLRRSGSELPFIAHPPGRATWELLLQRARGRYLQLEVTLLGDGRATPRLAALRVYFPRFSYLAQYLPAVYREDATSASLLERLLANFEGILTGIEDRIAAAQLLFDWRSAPAETLDWLADWFGLVTDPTWDEARKRLLLKYALTFFQARGTVAGLRLALRLALDAKVDDTLITCAHVEPHRQGIRIIEQFRTRRTPGLALGDVTAPAANLPTATSNRARWQPSAGAADLHRRYREFLNGRYRTTLPSALRFALRNPDWQLLPLRQAPPAGASVFTTPRELGDDALWNDFVLRQTGQISSVFPIAVPPGTPLLAAWNAFISEKAAAWSAFAQQALGFVPSVSASEQQLWRDFLTGKYADIESFNAQYATAFGSFAEVTLPDREPVGAVPRADWQEFIAALSGVTTVTRRRWQDFLARRYRSLTSLNAAHQSAWASFAAVPLPSAVPETPQRLADWFQFEGVVQAMHSTAHRFTVLLPITTAGTTAGTMTRAAAEEARRQRQAIAARIIALEKPAHTVFDVRFYRDLFRVGAVRLGFDTVLDQGSRAPDLLPPFVLDESFLGEGWLGVRLPDRLADATGDRLLLGSATLGACACGDFDAATPLNQ
ncbi:MAG: hypothetical protein HYR56_11980 [Acidobacteria bacterium]|nr:hypothetical protein [Acidobacteriota bacterium]MBI3422914.1 hypothetical protein [Acidobacteriota bacterium]